MKEEIKNNLIRQHEALKRALAVMSEREKFLVERDQGRPCSYVKAEISATRVSIYLIKEEQVRVKVQIARVNDKENKNGVGFHS